MNAEARDWPASNDAPRRAAISSFGFSGTNAHVVLEEAPLQCPVAGERPAYLVVLSARTAAQLKAQAERLATHLSAAPSPDIADIADIAYTLFVGRKHWHHRLAVVARDVDDLNTRLRAWLDGDAASGVVTAELDEKDHREDPGRTAAGDVLIDSMRNDAAMDEATYRDHLLEIGRLYLSGNGLRFTDLFDGRRRRVALPTYPFAPTRYWVDAPAAAPVSERPMTSLPAAQPLAKPSVIRLVEPAALAASFDAAPTRSATTKLVPLATLRDDAPAVVRRLPDVNGVRHLELLGGWGPSSRRRLAEEMAAAEGDEDVRVVLVFGHGRLERNRGKRPGAEPRRRPSFLPRSDRGRPRRLGGGVPACGLPCKRISVSWPMRVAISVVPI